MHSIARAFLSVCQFLSKVWTVTKQKTFLLRLLYHMKEWSSQFSDKKYDSTREAFHIQDLLHGSHITFEKSRTLRDSKDNLKLFCFKGHSSTFRLFRFRFIPTFYFFTRLLSAGHFYASVSLWSMNYELWLVENDPLYLKYWAKLTTFLRKCQFLIDIRS